MTSLARIQNKTEFDGKSEEIDYFAHLKDQEYDLAEKQHLNQNPGAELDGHDALNLYRGNDSLNLRQQASEDVRDSATPLHVDFDMKINPQELFKASGFDQEGKPLPLNDSLMNLARSNSKVNQRSSNIDTASLVRNLIAQQTYRPVASKQSHKEPVDSSKSRLSKISAGVTSFDSSAVPSADEQAEAQRMVADMSFLPSNRAIANQLREHGMDRITEMYSNSAASGRDRNPVAIVEKINAQPLGKVSTWTYSLLSELSTINAYVQYILDTFHGLFAKFHELTTKLHKFEWVCLVDNSGSMVTKEHAIAETLVVLMEALRKLEFSFALAKFGDRSGAVVIKEFTERFTRAVGQRVLESFTYNEGSYPATGLLAVANKIWPQPLRTEEKGSVHRIVIMITDGLTVEKNPQDFIQIREEKEFTFCVIHARDRPAASSNPQNNLRHVESFVRDIATQSGSGQPLYAVVEPGQHDQISSCLSQIISSAFASILEKLEAHEIKAKAGLASSERSVPKVSSLAPGGAAKSVSIRTSAERAAGDERLLLEAPSAHQVAHFYPINTTVGKMDFRSALESSAGARVHTMFSVSSPSGGLPFRECLGELKERSVDTMLEAISKVNASLESFLTSVQVSVDASSAATRAEAAWDEAVRKKSADINELALVLEDCVFPNNKYTRRRADLKGSQLYLPGLIKAVVTDFNYKKFFSNKTAGGKREYSVWLLLDVSLSMSGHLETCAVEAIVMMIGYVFFCVIFCYVHNFLVCVVHCCKPELRPLES